MNDLLDSLNPEQKAAVTLGEKSALILAGAGSGKTRVLTSRIAYLLQSDMAYPSEILAVTFTNKAAKEMLTRLSTMMPVNVRAMWVGTFHGLCNRMLRLHHNEAGLPASFAILDQSDQLSAVKRIMKANGISDEEFKPREVQNYINRCKEEGLRAKDAPINFQRGSAFREIYDLYEKILIREGACDFAELLLRSYELLKNHPLILEHYQNRFHFILIDEFQDTNKLQYRWIKLLSGIGEPGRRPNSVFAVGDDDQSIYAFRGANVGNMQDFVREFKIGEPIRLEQNYRSQGNILDAANGLIANNSQRLGKKLWTEAGEGDKVRVYSAPSDVDEAAYVVDTVKEYADLGTPYKEMAILYRSNAQSRVLEAEFTRRGIPYSVYGGLRFFDRAEIKNAISYMRLAENTADDSAFLRVVNLPARGIGAKTIETLINFAGDNGISLYDACGYAKGAAAAKLEVFRAIIEDLREKKDELPLSKFVDYTVEKSGLKEMYELDPNGSERLENLRELTSAATGYVDAEAIDEEDEEESVRDENMTALQGFLSHASLEAGENQAKADQDAVQLMTVHASKGLEFNLVFITGLEDGLFPHGNSMGSNKDLEEERRLMYVAITRARKNLYITLAERRMLHGTTRYSSQSMFLRELPEENLKWLSKPGYTDSDDSDDYSSSGSGYGFARGSKFSRRGSSDWSNNNYRESGRTYNSNMPEWAKGILGGKLEKQQENKIRAKIDNGSPYKSGDRLLHEKFGAGTVLSTKGAGEELVLQIKFDRSGVKDLLYRIAKKKISDI